MRYHSSQRNIVWTVLFSILLVVTLNACGDSNNVTGPPPPVPLSPDAKLSSLTVTSGSPQPAFSSDVANYSVEVATAVTSVTVTARAQNTGATVNINGQAATSQPVSIGAPGSSTAIPIVVTAVSGSQNTYIVTVNRTALGGNNNLRGLTVSPGLLVPAFAASVVSYTVNVASTVASVVVTAQPQDAGASVSINGQPTTNLLVTLSGAGTNTPISLVVTAPNGSQKPYLVTVNRAAPGGNNNLQSLSVSPGPLVPAFAASAVSYTVNVASTVASVAVTAQPQDAGATVSINGQPTTNQSVSLNAAGSSMAIPIVVTAVSGSQNTYIVTVNRTALGGNNNLRGLTVSPGPLAPAFTASIVSYTVNVASTVASFAVTAQPQDAGATVSINGQPTTNQSVSLNAAGSSTAIPIEVTAPNGSQKTYTVVVNRAAIVLSGNNNLSALAVSAGAFVPAFAATTTSYGLTVPNSTADTTVTATVADSTATLTINGSPATSGVAAPSIALAVGQNSITIVVTAGNGARNSYTVTITREDTPAP